jgi:hypothetical protein
MMVSRYAVVRTINHSLLQFFASRTINSDLENYTWNLQMVLRSICRGSPCVPLPHDIILSLGRMRNSNGSHCAGDKTALAPQYGFTVYMWCVSDFSFRFVQHNHSIHNVWNPCIWKPSILLVKSLLFLSELTLYTMSPIWTNLSGTLCLD